MMAPELAQLEMLAQVDELSDRLSDWAKPEWPWEPLNHCRSLIRRVLQRIETLRIRLEAPLVVATFGGTGTGKSALVNALVGRDITASGRQRPTTTRPRSPTSREKASPSGSSTPPTNKTTAPSAASPPTNARPWRPCGPRAEWPWRHSSR